MSDPTVTNSLPEPRAVPPAVRDEGAATSGPTDGAGAPPNGEQPGEVTPPGTAAPGDDDPGQGPDLSTVGPHAAGAEVAPEHAGAGGPGPTPGAQPADEGEAAADPRAARRQRVKAAVADWIDQLIDLGGSNRLLHYRDLAVGTLDLSDGEAVNAASLEQLRGGRKTRLRTLLPRPSDAADAARRLRAITAKAIENHEERGIQTLYLAVGLARWEVPTGAPAPAAPVLLLPLTAARRDPAGEDFDLDLDGDPELNPVLVHALATQHGISLDADEVLAEAQPEGLGTPDPELVFNQLVASCADLPSFRVEPRVIVANFTFAKLPMVRDLEQGLDRLVAHDLIAAMAGDPDAQTVVRGRRPAVDESLPDRLAPDEEFLVLPADASQHHVINRVLEGEHVLVQGPPGTGKSQTIANLITSLVARGRSVLFVAEKRAAIDAVVDRIHGAGLGDLVLDLHRDTISRSRVATSLAQALARARESTEPDEHVLHQNLVRQRDALVAHDRTMHARREPWGLSLYEVQARILGFDPSSRTALRFPRPVMDQLDAATLERLADELSEYLRLDGSAVATSGSPWATAQLTTPEAAERARQWAEYLLPVTTDLQARLDGVTLETGRRPPATLGGWRARLAELVDVADTLAFFQGPVFAPGTDLDDLARRLAPAASGAGFFTSTFSGSYRSARRQVAALCRTQPAPEPAELLTRLRAAAAQARQWSADSTDGGLPRVPASLAAARTALAQLDEGIEALSAFLAWIDVDGRSLPELVAWVTALTTDQATLFKLPRVRSIEASFAAAGATAMLDLARAERLSPEQAAACLRYAWHVSLYEVLGPPELGAFDPDVHTDRARHFQQLDQQHLVTTPARVLRRVAERITDVRNRFPDQSQLVENQANRKRGHLPLRQLARQAPDVLTALAPCWTMSPLLVPQLLAADRPYFDVVIFDEASQVTPADAVPALLRAEQVVVAGDSRQLPPTAFFATDTTADRLAEGDEDEDGEPGDTAAPVLDLGLTRGYESVLDVLASLLRPGHLTWHYRSRDERLIAFSNRHLYGGELTTFPDAGRGGGVTLDVVPFRPPTAGPGATSSETIFVKGAAEVDRVVERVVDHARSRPHESLGVITLGIAHAERIGEALRQRLAGEPGLAEFFRETGRERFFVKNLERVQGDERDAIILSIGYGRDADGRLRYRFGPLLQTGGERRLNVAVTRARTRLTVVSSFSADDLDPERSSAPGVLLLRDFLAYAAAGGARGEGGEDTDGVDDGDAFQRYLRDWLAAAGLPSRSRYGASGYRLDLALFHPDDAERPVLALECDGPTYHAGRTARDRDRLRPEVLEDLGWRFHRVWSTGFYRDPRRETDLIVAAWREAVADADQADQTDQIGTVVQADPAEHGGGVLSGARLTGDGEAAGALASSAGDASPARDALGSNRTVATMATGTSPAAAWETAAAGPAGRARAIGADPDERPPAPALGRLGPKPVEGGGRPIAEYDDAELLALVLWIESDTRLRTDDELQAEMVDELGYSRLGPRIAERLERVIAMAHGSLPGSDPARGSMG